MTPDFQVHCAVDATLAQRATTILTRIVQERTGLKANTTAAETADVVLDVRSAIGAEGYRIDSRPGGGIIITGGCARGVLYGVGRFVHEALYETGRITPGAWRGISLPDCSLRGIYLAFHTNYYSLAPLDELLRYLESLALWGINTVACHFPNPRLLDTPEARAAHERHRAILQGAKAVGMRIALLESLNCGDIDAPREAYAPPFPDTVPPRRGLNGIRVCPSHPAGFAYLTARLARYLDRFSDIGIDFITAFPYDSGGCGCPDCWPWGARGYLTLSREFVRLARQREPGIRFILGTWCYDVCETSDGEWEGLTQALATNNDWVDFIMADSHFEYPAYPLQHGVPGGAGLINFAEISMWGRFPWGGFGANPLPARFQRIWDETAGKLEGGLPYSEGIFEDINKVIFARFFWDKSTRATDAVRDYIAYEYGPAGVDPVSEAIALLEQNYPFATWQRENVERATNLILQADAQLDPRARASWRWRILYLRALIDYELATHANEVTDRCDAAYEELIRIFHLEEGWFCVTPPSRAYRRRHEEKQRLKTATTPPGHESSETLPPGADQGKLKQPT